jgi:hypothetical protein
MNDLVTENCHFLSVCVNGTADDDVCVEKQCPPPESVTYYVREIIRHESMVGTNIEVLWPLHLRQAETDSADLKGV